MGIAIHTPPLGAKPEWASELDVPPAEWERRQADAPAGLVHLKESATRRRDRSEAERRAEEAARLVAHRTALELAVASETAGAEWLAEYRHPGWEPFLPETVAWVVWYDLREVGHQPIGLRLEWDEGRWSAARLPWLVKSSEVRAYADLADALVGAASLPRCPF